MAGYSGTPVTKKLGIRPNTDLVLINNPSEYEQLIGSIPEGVRITHDITKNTDMIHVFSTRKGHLAKSLQRCVRRMSPDVVVWVSWPKKASRMETDITEDTVREIALPLGLVDIKVCAIDEIWSGLKLVIRKERRETG